MANSKYGYVRAFEQPDQLLPNTFIVVRIDGRGFTKLTTKYKFVKPNDRRALDLMNDAAEAVMKDLPDLVLAYGQSDEFSFVFHKDCTLFERRASKLVTTIVSTFTANYVFGWAKYFPEAPLTPPLPSFDGRAVCYPSNANLRDYLSWRQADCHINNLYNTTFWALVQKGGFENRAAEKELSGTVSADKNEILFSRFGINYNNEPDIFKKGSVLYRDFFPTSTQSTPTPAKAAPAQDEPYKSTTRPMSQQVERSNPENFRSSPVSAASTTSTSRGPTFLSTSTTPDVSPPASPVANSSPAFADGLSETISVGLPSTFTPMASPANNSAYRHALPPLTPIPLPPPTLKPSTRPPPSLNPPNPTLHTNTSPLPSPYSETPTVIPSRTLSNSKRRVKPVAHSASASLSRPPPNQQQSMAPYRPSPKRSPSLSVLETGLAGRSPPEIPLRISSIPLNAPPRKLSLPTQKSSTLLRNHDGEAPTYGSSSATASNTAAQRNNGASSSRVPPSHHTHIHAPSHSHSHPQPLRIMKELPSPPTASEDNNDDNAVRSFVMGSEPPAWSTSPPPTRGHSYMQAHAMETVVASPIEPELEPGMNTAYAFPAPPSSNAQNVDGKSQSEQTTPKARAMDSRSQLAAFAWTPASAAASLPASASAPPAITTTVPTSTSTSTSTPNDKPPASTRTNNNKKAKKILGVDDDGVGVGMGGGNEGRPLAQSRTQREKERKKRGKARIITEHVDIIGEGFWERRGWVLSGRVG